jgi:pimeloyl-ACP methyl ester carboxylesterase
MNMKKVISKDGTTIAFEQSGTGLAVILVDGALAYREYFGGRPLAAELSKGFTVITYDRRGSGESTDIQPYAVEREIEDIDALIAEAGGSAYLYGVSSGAVLALMPLVPAEHHGRLVILALMAHTGATGAGEQAVAPFRALATPIADIVKPMRYPELYTLFEDGPGPAHVVAHSMFLDAVDSRVAETIVDHLQASTAPLAVAQLRVLGGAMARVPVEATAFAHRASRIMVNVAAFYDGPEDRAVREAWVSDFAAALRLQGPRSEAEWGGDAGAYVNFLGDEGEARIRAAYPGATWDRLAAIKARYDPTNLFRLNQNIPPAIEGPG